MTISLDFTRETVVIVCDKCPHWRALRFDRGAAWAAASMHESSCHPGDLQARLAFGVHRSRQGAAE